MRHLSRNIIAFVAAAAAISAMVAIGLYANSDAEHQLERTSVRGVERQRALRSLIQGYIADGLLLKLEMRGATPNVFVTGDFGLLTSNEKLLIMKVVLDFVRENDASVKSLELFDAQTERAIGEFDGSHIAFR